MSFHSLPWFLYCDRIRRTVLAGVCNKPPLPSSTHLPELCHCQVKANAECECADKDGRDVDRVALEEVDLCGVCVLESAFFASL